MPPGMPCELQRTARAMMSLFDLPRPAADAARSLKNVGKKVGESVGRSGRDGVPSPKDAVSATYGFCLPALPSYNAQFAAMVSLNCSLLAIFRCPFPL